VTKTTTSPANSWEFAAEMSREFSPVLSREGSWEIRKAKKSSGLLEGKATRHAADKQRLPSFKTPPPMIIAGPILMRSPPPGPLTDQRRGRRSRPDGASQQVAHFAGGKFDER
jgi:hypothetical protein